MSKCLAVDVGHQVLVNDIIFQIEVNFHELFEYLLHSQVVDQGIGVQPLQMLVSIHEHSTPVGREFEFIFRTLEISGLNFSFFGVGTSPRFQRFTNLVQRDVGHICSSRSLLLQQQVTLPSSEALVMLRSCTLSWNLEAHVNSWWHGALSTSALANSRVASQVRGVYLRPDVASFPLLFQNLLN